jgi:hypothetical protein
MEGVNLIKTVSIFVNVTLNPQYKNIITIKIKKILLKSQHRKNFKKPKYYFHDINKMKDPSHWNCTGLLSEMTIL